MTENQKPERKMLRIEARNAAVPIERKPDWIKTRAKMGPEYQAMHALVKTENLHTVCQEAGCPNIYECWEDREATFLIGGAQCTRRCDFCQIDTGKPSPLDVDEPRRVGDSVTKMQLRYATVTGVARDDLEDEGSWLYAETIRQIHLQSPGTGVEILVPDFSGNPDHLKHVFDTAPEVFAHNVETVPRIFKQIRPAFTYEKSLRVLRMAQDFGLITRRRGIGTVVTAGLVAGHTTGPFASVRLRSFGTQPLTEDNSVTQPTSTTLNARVGWKNRDWEFALSLLNALDRRSDDIAYVYTSRLEGEPAAGLKDTHLHPAEPRTLRLGLTRRF